MRINCYQFPKSMSDKQRFDAYFEMLLWNPKNNPAEIEWRRQQALQRGEVKNTPHEIEAIKVSTAKKLLKTYGGVAFTQHFDRDGGLFESTEITLNGNNSNHKYNRHL